MGDLLPFRRPGGLEPVLSEKSSMYRSGVAVCGCCGHRWIAMFPASVADVTRLQCPASPCQPATFVDLLDLAVHGDDGGRIT